MAAAKSFNGFPQTTVAFFTQLKKNNDKDWFAAHKADFDAHVMAPAKEFVAAMGDAFQQISPDIVAEPAVNKSIFRIYRDTRFSADKTPYKTHLGIYFWEGPLPKMECPGFYFHLEPPGLMLGAGDYMFSKPVLAAFRQAVAHDDRGGELVKIIKSLENKGYTIGVPHYKRVPQGYDPDHPRADLLKFKGITAMITLDKAPPALHSPKIVDLCIKHFKAMAPIQQWQLDVIRSM